MGQPILNKILSRASGGRSISVGDIVVVEAHTVVLYDSNFFPVYWRDPRKIEDPSRICVIFDHRVPAPDRGCAQAHIVGRKFAEKFGIDRLHDVGYDQGIAHTVVADKAYSLPGTVLICSDSHTGGAGALNCAARGVGGPDIIYAAIKGQTWFEICDTIRYELTGRLGTGVTGKDVFLHIAQTFGDHSGYNVEFGGPALKSLGIDARRTIATMGTELNAEFSIFEPDQILLDYVRERNPSARFEPQYADDDADYAEHRTLDLNEINPLVALPDAMLKNAVPVQQVIGQKIDQAFIGSCANGNLEDLAIAARVVAGRRVAPGVRFLVTPGSQAVYRQALKAGYIETLLEAGAVVTPATCGACGGGHMGVLGENETCITASTRNFKGRMGDPSARIFMGSPATVAASAIAGVITHPQEYLLRNSQ
ncbi:MAG: 3-isopropylmalate dehydratase large subunit [Croceibacterium sp.]